MWDWVRDHGGVGWGHRSQGRVWNGIRDHRCTEYERKRDKLPIDERDVGLNRKISEEGT